MPETIYEMSKRLCENRPCENCVLNNSDDYCLIYEIVINNVKKADEYLDTLRKWAEEHPVKTYEDVFLERFPNARISDKDGSPTVCRKMVFGGFTALSDCIDNGDECKKCWNEPYKE